MNRITDSLRNLEDHGRRSTKHQLKWAAAKRLWYEQNPPDHAGYYYCHYCGKAMTRAECTLDHLKIRSHYPELRYELSNLVPCCHKDNYLRGSRDYESFVREYYPHLLE